MESTNAEFRILKIDSKRTCQNPRPKSYSIHPLQSVISVAPWCLFKLVMICDYLKICCANQYKLFFQCLKSWALSSTW